MAIHWIYASKEAASDDELLILSLSMESGENVRRLDVIAEVEGSKSAFEIQAEDEGSIYYYVEQGSRVKIGAVIACICTEKEIRPDAPSEVDGKSQDTITSQFEGAERFSKSALLLLESEDVELGLVNPDAPFVTESDVKKYLETRKVSGRFRPLRVAFLGGSYGATLALEALAGDSSTVVTGVFDDKSNILEEFEFPLLGKLDREVIKRAFESKMFDSLLITIQANMPLRKNLFAMCDELGIRLHTAIHPGASISKTAIVEAGCIIMDQVRIGPEATVSRNVFISGMVNIDHHTTVGENTTFGPGVFLSGCVSVGKDCTFGTSIGVESHVVIGDGCVVTSGCVIQSDLKDFHVSKSQNKPITRPIEQQNG